MTPEQEAELTLALEHFEEKYGRLPDGWHRRAQSNEIDSLKQDLDAANAEIARLKGVVAAMDRGLQLIAGQCGTPDSADGCRLILRTVARVREAARIKMEEHTDG